MNFRSFGKTDLKVSEMGLGCQSLGGGFYYKDDQESIRMLLHAYDSGVNFYDTSDHYSQGLSETLIGQAFNHKRGKVIIATKGGTRFSPLGSIALRMRSLLRPVSCFFRNWKIYLHLMRATQRQKDFSPKYLEEALNRSLKRLKTDYIDLYQLHKPSVEVLERGDFIEVLEKLKNQGKIRYYGVSCTSIDEAFICFKHPTISSVQITFNLLDQEAVPKFLPMAREKNLAVIARNPRAQGHLTTALSDIMAETYARNQKEVNERMDRARQFLFLANQERTFAQTALRFALQIQGVSVIIPRAINVKELDENLGALSAPLLTYGDLEKVKVFSQTSYNL